MTTSPEGDFDVARLSLGGALINGQVNAPWIRSSRRWPEDSYGISSQRPEYDVAARSGKNGNEESA
jgi:hypothetical protein